MSEIIMSELKKRKHEESDNKLFQISIDSDSYATVAKDPRFDAFPMDLVSTVARQIREQHIDDLPVGMAGPIHVMTYCVCTTAYAWPRYAAPTTYNKATHKFIWLARFVALDTIQIEKLRGQGLATTD